MTQLLEHGAHGTTGAAAPSSVAPEYGAGIGAAPIRLQNMEDQTVSGTTLKQQNASKLHAQVSIKKDWSEAPPDVKNAGLSFSIFGHICYCHLCQWSIGEH